MWKFKKLTQMNKTTKQKQTLTDIENKLMVTKRAGRREGYTGNFA